MTSALIRVGPWLRRSVLVCAANLAAAVAEWVADAVAAVVAGWAGAAAPAAVAVSATSSRRSP